MEVLPKVDSQWLVGNRPVVAGVLVGLPSAELRAEGVVIEERLLVRRLVEAPANKENNYS